MKHRIEERRVDHNRFLPESSIPDVFSREGSLEGIMLSKSSPLEKEKYPMISLIGGI